MTWAHKARGSEGGEPDETGFPREGYQLGDLAGAVSLAIPMEVYEAEARERTMANVSLFGALAAVIVAVAVAVNGALRRQGARWTPWTRRASRPTAIGLKFSPRCARRGECGGGDRCA